MGELSPSTFKVEGVMTLRNGERRKFTVFVRGLKEEHAIERVYSTLGGRHKLTRRHIKIISVEKVKPDEIDDEYIRELAETQVIFAA